MVLVWWEQCFDTGNMVAPVYRQATLLGVDHTELGEIELVELTADLAVGISCGRFPKGYPHAEPNEDAVFAATDGRTTILAVADGHNGSWASHTAIDAIASASEPSIGEPDVLDRLLREVGVRMESPQDDSETALGLLVVTSSGVEVAQFGDTAFLHAHEDGAEVRVGTADFLRRGDSPDRSSPQHMSGLLGLVTDGVTSFIPSTMSHVYARHDGETAADYARRLVEEAFDGGAGDNIAVAALFLG